jgi:hypothetical protein
MGHDVPMATDPRTSRVNVRVPQHLRDALDREAERERRNLADIVNILLEDAIAARRKAARRG